MSQRELEEEFGKGVNILDYRDNMVMRRVMQTRDDRDTGQANSDNEEGATCHAELKIPSQ
jgi:hypothetical protein